MITENLSTLKIHKLTQEQYDRELATGNLDDKAIYLTPDDNSDISIHNESASAHADIRSLITDLQNEIASLKTQIASLSEV